MSFSCLVNLFLFVSAHLLKIVVFTLYVCLIHTCRHASRCVLIEFSLPEVELDLTMDEQEVWDNLEVTKDEASSCVGFCIGLGSTLEGEGYKEIRERFVPVVHTVLTGVQPRVITGYAILHFSSPQR